MSRDTIDALFSKIRRADKHISDLDFAIKQFVVEKPYRIIGILDKVKKERVWSIEFNAIPPEIYNVAADAVHNLRTPLDKMLTDSAPRFGIHRKNPKIGAIKFPFFDHINESSKVRERLNDNFTAQAAEFLIRVESFRGGRGHELWAINHLDNRDKHRELVAPISTGFSTAEVRNWSFVGGSLLRIGSRNGRHLVARPGGSGDMIQECPDLSPILRANYAMASPYYLEFTSPQNDMEICTSTPVGRLNADINPNLAIAFSDVVGFEETPIIESLAQMRKAVITVINEFTAAFY